jgi:predicted dehydrogenase
MRILILGNSNIFQRKVYKALSRIKKIKIELASKSPNTNNLKLEKFYNSYEEALKETSAKIVYISLINSKHFTWAIKCLDANKHIIVDKPLALNFTQTQKILNLASKKKLLVSEAIVFDKHAQFKNMYKKIDLNHPTKIYSSFHIPKLDKKNFRNYKGYGGGCFQDMSPYALSMVNLFFKNKKYSLSIKKIKNKKGLIVCFQLIVKSKYIYLEASFSFNSFYKNEILIHNKKKKYFINYAFSPPIDKSLKLDVSNEVKKKSYKVKFKKQNAFYTYFIDIFKILRKKKYNFFYKEIKNIAKIKEKIS